MKKSFKYFLVLILTISVILSGCSKNDSKNKEQNNKDKKVIYTTFFPVYDLTKLIVKDKMEVKTIIKGNEEPHNFELKAQNMKEISNADLIIYNGANMENFIDALKKSTNNDDKFLDLSKGLTLLEGKGGDDGLKKRRRTY